MTLLSAGMSESDRHQRNIHPAARTYVLTSRRRSVRVMKRWEGEKWREEEVRLKKGLRVAGIMRHPRFHLKEKKRHILVMYTANLCGTEDNKSVPDLQVARLPTPLTCTTVAGLYARIKQTGCCMACTWSRAGKKERRRKKKKKYSSWHWQMLIIFLRYYWFFSYWSFKTDIFIGMLRLL